MELARLLTIVVSAAVCCAKSVFDGTLPAMFGLGMCDCPVLGRMVETCC
jgi:hypothetical protein